MLVTLMPRIHHEEVLFIVSLPAYLTTVWLFYRFMHLGIIYRVLLQDPPAKPNYSMVPRAGFEPAHMDLKGPWLKTACRTRHINKFLFLVLTRGHNATIDLQTMTYLGLERHQSGQGVCLPNGGKYGSRTRPSAVTVPRPNR